MKILIFQNTADADPRRDLRKDLLVVDSADGLQVQGICLDSLISHFEPQLLDDLIQRLEAQVLFLCDKTPMSG